MAGVWSYMIFKVPYNLNLNFLFCLVLCTALGQNHHNNDVRTKQEVGEKSTYPYEMQ